MPVLVRPAEPTDVEALARLHVETWAETYRVQLPDVFFGERALEHRRGFWATTLVERPSADHVIVAADEGGLVGFGFSGPAVPDDDGAPTPRQLYALYVRASHHGLGVGQALIDAVVGDGPASLWVARDNPRARRFYERNGFVADGHEKPDERVPTFWQIRMVRR